VLVIWFVIFCCKAVVQATALYYRKFRSTNCDFSSRFFRNMETLFRVTTVFTVMYYRYPGAK